MRKYQKMDVYKVSFNANEQVAAAACTFWQAASKYTNTWDMYKDGCEYKLLADGSYESLDGKDETGAPFVANPAWQAANPDYFTMKYRG